MLYLTLFLLVVATTATLWLWRARRALLIQHQAMQREVSQREQALRARVALEERERIFSDLHDDLGARLLELIYTAPDSDSADRARAILQNLRDVVSRSRGDPGTLHDVLDSIRAETAQRLVAVGSMLDWQASEDLPDPPIDTGSALHLHRIVREAVSNAIRHAHTRRLRIRLRLGGRDSLLVEITDDGAAGGQLAASDGRGVGNMRERASALAGDISWIAGTEGGTKVLLEVPLPEVTT